jgi:cellulose 1,4-beta-cellobiosidase
MFKTFCCALFGGVWLWQALAQDLTANPFAGPMYVNPTFQANIDRTLAATQDAVTLQNLRLIRNAPSAYWIDRRAKIRGSGLDSLEGILADAARQPSKPSAVFMVYNLPNRDCNARASNGELCCTYLPDGRCDYSKNTDNCQAGLNQYMTEYIDPYVDVVSRYQDRVNIALVIEPDSLPNLVTNMGNPACRNSERVYKDGITYAVRQLASKAPKVALYLDAAHGGWLGWKDSNLVPFSKLVSGMGIVPQLRGFATNVANYQPLGKMCPQVDWCLPHNNKLSDPCCADPCKLTTQYNGAVNELNYVQLLGSYFPGKRFIVDTGRNGVPNARTDCANWCNPRDMGLGQYPTVDTGVANIDAFLWLKTPGEGDGCTEWLPDGKRCPRFDSMCASVDSIGSRAGEPRAPEAGGWFLHQIQMLARNAQLGKIPAGVAPAPAPSPVPAPNPTSNPAPVPAPAPAPSPVPNPSSGSQTFQINGCTIRCEDCTLG